MVTSWADAARAMSRAPKPVHSARRRFIERYLCPGVGVDRRGCARVAVSAQRARLGGARDVDERTARLGGVVLRNIRIDLDVYAGRADEAEILPDAIFGFGTQDGHLLIDDGETGELMRTFTCIGARDTLL